MQQATKEANICMNFDTSYEIVSWTDGRLVKTLRGDFSRDTSRCSCQYRQIKNHGFTQLSGAVKNIFGVIPSLVKPGYHVKLSTASRFAAMLLDLAACISPRLSIIDAVVGMEGDGPSTGNPRGIGFLLSSANPLALDVVASEPTSTTNTASAVIAVTKCVRTAQSPFFPVSPTGCW